MASARASSSATPTSNGKWTPVSPPTQRMCAAAATPDPSTAIRSTQASWRSFTRCSPESPDEQLVAEANVRRATGRRSALPADSPSAARLVLAVLDLPQHPRGGSGRDREWLDVFGDDAVGANHTALADAHAARDDDVGAQPAVIADPRGAPALDTLPGDWLLGIVVAVACVTDE